MFNKLGTRTLVIVAAVLGLIWFLADRFGTGSQQRTFRSEILRLDTAAVSRIRISSRVTAHKPVLLERTGAQEWLVKYEGTEHRGSHATIQRLLSELRSLDADRMIGKMDAVKDRYDLSDSLATTVTITVNGTDRTLAFGKRVQANNGPFTYVNLSGENEVYAIAGNVGGELDNKADHWRPRELMTGDPATWQRITFTYPADTGYVLERNGAGWLVDSMPADSGKVNNYLKSIALSKAQIFADSVDVSTMTPAYVMKVEDTARPEPVLVQAYPYGYSFLITSTLNPGSAMYFDPQREMPRLFRPRHRWFPDPPPPTP